MQILNSFHGQNVQTVECRHIIHLSTANHHKVINSQKQAGFGPPCTVYMYGESSQIETI